MSMMSSIFSLVLAAGAGKRMHSALPKPLHQLGGRPMLSYVLDVCSQVASQVGLVVSTSVQENFHVPENIEVFVQKNPAGTGDAVKAALPWIKQCDGDIFILFGDTPLLPKNILDNMLSEKQSAGADLVLLGMHVNDPSGYGRIMLDSDGYVAEIIEDKNTTDESRACTFCNSGVMLISASILQNFLNCMTPDAVTQEYYLTDIVTFCKRKDFMVTAVSGPSDRLAGVNTRFQLAEMEKDLQEIWRYDAMVAGVTLLDPSSTYFSFDTKLGRDVVIEPHVFFGPGVQIDNHVMIKAFSHIEGASIGSGSVIGPFARLRPGTVMAENVRIGNFVEVKKSTLDQGVKINHLSYVGDAVVGAATNIGAGTITCNYDGFQKYQTTFGKNVFVGSNSCFVAPVFIDDNAVIGAGSVITKEVSKNDLAVSRAVQMTVKDGGASYRHKREK